MDNEQWTIPSRVYRGTKFVHCMLSIVCDPRPENAVAIIIKIIVITPVPKTTRPRRPKGRVILYKTGTAARSANVGKIDARMRLRGGFSVKTAMIQRTKATATRIRKSRNSETKPRRKYSTSDKMINKIIDAVAKGEAIALTICFVLFCGSNIFVRISNT